MDKRAFQRVMAVKKRASRMSGIGCVGLKEGKDEGLSDGDQDGVSVGATLGDLVGVGLGGELGTLEGLSVGIVGTPVGDSVG